MNTINTFEKPDTVKPAAFRGVKASAGGFAVTIPSKAVVVLSE